MYCLSIDTTAKTASVCISRYENDTLLPVCETNLNATLTHSETLLPMVDEVLSLAGLSLADIGVLAVSTGPGSFTGVRIGTAAVKGLSFSMVEKGFSHVCVPVSSLEALANNLRTFPNEGTVICPVMDARRSQVYNALFFPSPNCGNPIRLCDDRLLTANELCCELNNQYKGKAVILVGDGANVAKRAFDESECAFNYSITGGGTLYQRAYSVALSAFDYKEAWLSRKDDYTGARLSPTYLRASQAERELAEKQSEKNNSLKENIK